MARGASVSEPESASSSQESTTGALLEPDFLGPEEMERPFNELSNSVARMI